MNRKEIYKFPLVKTKGYMQVFTQKSDMHAFDFVHKKLNDDQKTKVVDRLNGLGKGFIAKEDLRYSHGDSTIFHKEEAFIQLRGWGHLTGVGGGLGLDYSEAAKIQDDFAEWIIKQLTR